MTSYPFIKMEAGSHIGFYVCNIRRPTKCNFGSQLDLQIWSRLGRQFQRYCHCKDPGVLPWNCLFMLLFPPRVRTKRVNLLPGCKLSTNIWIRGVDLPVQHPASKGNQLFEYMCFCLLHVNAILRRFLVQNLAQYTLLTDRRTERLWQYRDLHYMQSRGKSRCRGLGFTASPEPKEEAQLSQRDRATAVLVSFGHI